MLRIRAAVFIASTSLMLAGVVACGGGELAQGGPAADAGSASPGAEAAGSTEAGAETNVAGPEASTLAGHGSDGGGHGSDGGAPGGRVPTTGSCGNLASVGTWEEITPSGVPLPGAAPCNYGTLRIVNDPSTPSTLYLGTCQYGVWKSSDCGGTWTHIDTGMNAASIDASRQWDIVVDPIDPQILYANAGYNSIDGNDSGAFKSTDGGVDWQRIWPPADPSLATVVRNNFVTGFSMDPTNHLHVLMGFHEVCAAPYTSTCYAETRDGGATWTLHNADSRWGASEAQQPIALGDKVWLFEDHDQTAGIWVTTDGGSTWALAVANAVGHWPGQLYHAKSGWYLGNDLGLLHSADGVNWAQIANFPGGITTGLVGDGTTMWASNWGSYQPWNASGVGNPYVSSPEADGQTWTATSWTDPPGFIWTQGGNSMAFDPIDHVLFSSNGTQGLWRVRVQ
jgi:hypothetical protein